MLTTVPKKRLIVINTRMNQEIEAKWIWGKWTVIKYKQLQPLSESKFQSFIVVFELFHDRRKLTRILHTLSK